MKDEQGKLFQVNEKHQRDSRALWLIVVVTLVALILFALAQSGQHVVVILLFTIAATSVIAVVIWQACDPFAEAAQWIGIRFRIPSSVRGATLDAVASSMPELFSGIFFVTVAISSTSEGRDRLLESTEGFGSSIAVCAGSSIYNLMLIPAVCAIAVSVVRPNRPQIEFSKDVVYRDGAWVIASQIGLLVILFLPRLYWWMAVFGIAAYGIYVLQMILNTRRHQQNHSGNSSPLPAGSHLFFGYFNLRFTLTTVLLTLVTATLLAAAACYALVKLTNYSAAAMNVPPFFVAVILAAAASSIPDTFVSLGSARRGDDSGAISNVFGSNIFDICIGMSIPLLVCCFLNDWQPIDLVSENRDTIQGVAALRVLLFVLTSIVMFLLWTRRKIDRHVGIFFCGLYLIFVGYAVLGSMNVI